VNGELIHLESHSDGMVAAISLNRPEKRNALSIALMEQLLAAVQSSATNTNRRVLVLRGNGPVFCAGLDLTEASDLNRVDRSAHLLRDVYQAICQCPLVTIAAAHGTAMGGGVGLLGACDLVVAADDLHISFPEVHRGLVAALVTAVLQRQLAERTLRELILLGQTIPANQALSIGLVNRVVPSAHLTDEVNSLAEQAIAGAPGAISRTKLLLDTLSSRPISDELDRALQIHLLARNDAEAAEGVAAFLEKRQPMWGPRTSSS
jgi:methylglutaconyl-CoA hydratase